MTPNHLELKSADGTKLNLEALYQIAPSCFTEVKDEKTGELRHVVNFTTLRQLLGDDAVDDAPEMYQFTWPGKQEARREAARPITDTLRPCPEESVDWDTTQNLYIEGDNLAVLKLLQKGYMGKVKMIYIDPPYNTGSDFVYHDDFAVSQKEMDLFSGDIDEEGNRYRKNTESNGRFHSDWCSMMYSRLSIARTLLKEDGVIFISIDDNEVSNLRKLCDCIFGERNFVSNLIWQKKFSRSNDATYFSSMHDHILCYCKNNILVDDKGWEIGLLPRGEEIPDGYSNPDNDPRGPWTSTIMSAKSGGQSLLYEITIPSGRVVTPPSGRFWSCSKETFNKWNEDNRIWFGVNGDSAPRKKTFLSEVQAGLRPNSILFQDEVGNNQEAKQEVKSLFGGLGVFDGPKPVRLLKTLLTIGNVSSEDIVLDFFSGSATTAHATMQLNEEDGGNRKYILVQLPEETPEDSEARRSGYNTITEIAKDRIRCAAKSIVEHSPLSTQNLDTGFRVFKLSDSNFNEVYFTPKEFTQDILSGLESNIKEGRTDLDLLFGAMLDWGVQLSLPMSKETVDGCDIYTVNEGDLVACFSENITENVVSAMASRMPLRVLFRDSCFSEDKAKINVFELFKQKLDWGEDEAIKNIRVI